MQVELNNFLNEISPYLRSINRLLEEKNNSLNLLNISPEDSQLQSNSNYEINIVLIDFNENCKVMQLDVYDFDTDKNNILYIESFKFKMKVNEKTYKNCYDYQLSEDRQEKKVNRKYGSFFIKNKNKIISVLDLYFKNKK